MSYEIVIIVLLILANGVFAGAEIAVLSVPRGELASEVRRRNPRALAVRALHEQPERFLATVQIGITLVGAAAAAFGGASLARDLVPVLERLGVGTAADELALVGVVALVAALSLVFGELVPKSLALRYARPYAFAAARPLLVLAQIARPVVWSMTACSNLVLRLFGDRTTFTEARLSPDELRHLVDEAGRAGAVDPDASQIARRALAFGEVRVGEVMVPRERIVGLRRDASVEEIQRVLLEEGHARMPVYDGELDRIVGYVVARDVLALVWERGLLVLDDILRRPYLVGLRTPAIEALREMQRLRTQLAIVTDDHGAVVGLVTIEDLIEELVGDIFDEHEPAGVAIREPDGTARVPGWAPVRRVNRELGIELPVGADRTTIAGLCMTLAQAIPQAGARLEVPPGVVLEVLEASPRRVRMVRIRPAGV